MKNIALPIFAAFLLLTGFNARAQVKVASGEQAAQMVEPTDSTAGGMMILPAQSQEDAPAILEKEEPVIKNVAHRRSAKIGKMVNGYYQMAGERDWGTNARLNAYGYVQYAPPASYTPSADMPVYPAGVEETDADTGTDQQDQENKVESDANQFDW